MEGIAPELTAPDVFWELAPRQELSDGVSHSHELTDPRHPHGDGYCYRPTSQMSSPTQRG